jgi:hypothetical protein
VPDWDEDSARLRSNLTQVLRDVRDSADRRDAPTVEGARKWQADTMAGLDVPDAEYVGRFRGEPGLENTRVWIDANEGMAPAQVAGELAAFEQRLQRTVAALDALYPTGTDLDADGLAAVIDLSAWAHSEWVRIHPFANGNGRTARIWANSLFMRYGLPPVVRLRPRPDGGYGSAGAVAMDGNWQPTAVVFRRYLLAALSDAPRGSPPPQPT